MKSNLEQRNKFNNDPKLVADYLKKKNIKEHVYIQNDKNKGV